MNGGAQPGVAARRAALAIHALGEEDRAWILAQLQPQQRAQIGPLLDELRDLGIQADGRALEQIESGSPSPVPPAARLGRLSRPELRRLARVLEQEPPEVTRALLAAAGPRLRGSLLTSLDPGFAIRVNGLTSTGPGSPALVAALVAVIEGRMERPADVKQRTPWWSLWTFSRRTA